MLPGQGTRIGWRWIVVVAVVAVLCCLPALASVLPASVPALTAGQLESRILGSQRLAFSGYAESDATFGLPPLPAFSSVTPLLDGVTRMRVWHAAPDRWRVDTLSDAGEDDTYQAGAGTYVWDSGEQLLTGIIGPQAIRLPRAADLVPAALAVRILNEAGPGAKVSLLPPQRVAGQSAAGLEITPAAPQSTMAQSTIAQSTIAQSTIAQSSMAQSSIARADIWAAPATGLPLLVEVFDHGATQPALDTRFLQAGTWAPDPGVLTPRRVPGTGFTTTTPSDFSGVLNNLDGELLPAGLAGLGRMPSPVPQVGVYGGGLTSFAVLTFRHGTGGPLLQDALDAGATRLTVPGGTGAVASAPLVNLVLVHPYRSPDTFLLIGFVSKAALEQAAGVLAAKPDQDLEH